MCARKRWPCLLQVVTVSADKTAKVWAVAEGGSTGEVVATFLFSASGVEQQSGGQASNTKAPVDFMQVRHP